MDSQLEVQCPVLDVGTQASKVCSVELGKLYGKQHKTICKGKHKVQQCGMIKSVGCDSCRNSEQTVKNIQCSLVTN